MTLEEAIKTALVYENKIFATYNKAEAEAADETGKRIFKVLATEEQGHIDYLESCLAQWQKTGKLTVEKLETAIPSREAIAKRVGELDPNTRGEASPKEVELLDQALAAEVETSSFYKRMVEELDDEGKALFKRFVEIEEGHVSIVEAELDSVKGLGFWFGMQEFSLEAE